MVALVELVSGLLLLLFLIGAAVVAVSVAGWIIGLAIAYYIYQLLRRI